MNDFVETLKRAKAGESIGMIRLYQMYAPLLTKLAVVNGVYDEDLFQELVEVFLKCVDKFNPE